jgi:hypothetical protein
MNLYKITVGHAAPKDFHKSMVCLLLAENDEAVFDWIASEPDVNGSGLFNSWADNVEDWAGNNDDEEWDDEQYPDFKAKIVALKGEINDEDYDFTDSYYGITLYGWELLAENYTHDMVPALLIEKQIIFTA